MRSCYKIHTANSIKFIHKHEYFSTADIVEKFFKQIVQLLQCFLIKAAQFAWLVKILPSSSLVFRLVLLVTMAVKITAS